MNATVVELVATATATSGATGRRDLDVCLAARLSDDRLVVLLNDRGFTTGAHQALRPQPEPDDDDLFICAWCVGPDEKYDDRTGKDMADAHFGALAERLRAAGVQTTAAALVSAPFRVIWDATQRLWPESLDWY